MYEWSELINLWEREQITVEQAIGQLITHGEAQAAQIVALQRQVEALASTSAPRAGGQPPVAPPKQGATVRRQGVAKKPK